jgi:hypothetical protein
VKFIRTFGEPHFPRPHEGRLVGPRRRHGRRLRRPRRASATRAASGTSARSATATSSFEDIIVALNDVGYRGPLSVEWEDSRMDRVHGATEAAAVRPARSTSRRARSRSTRQFDKKNQ